MKSHNLWGRYFQTKNILFLSVILETILFYLYYFPEPKLLFGDEVRYLETGFLILSGADWHSNPMWPPMQSVLIALFAKIFSHPLLPIQLFQYGLLLLSGFIIKDIIWRETRNNTSSQIALAVMLLYPSWLAYSQYLWPEVIHVTLFVSIIWINRYKNSSYNWMLLSGLLLGLVILFKSLLILFIPFLYLPSLIKFRKKTILIKMVLSLMLAVIIITPTSIKSHQMNGGWMVSNSSMFNLYLGLEDDKRQHFSHKMAGSHYSEYTKSANTFTLRNEIVKNKALNKISKDGYINTILAQLNKQYFRLFDYQTFFSQQFAGKASDNYLGNYHHHSDEALVLIINTYNNLFYFIIVLAMFFGITVSFNKSIIIKQFTFFLLYILGLFLLLHAIPRFRIPLVPVMAFFSGYLYYHLSTIGFNFQKKFRVSLLLLLLVFVTFLLFAGHVLDIYFPI